MRISEQASVVIVEAGIYDGADGKAQSYRAGDRLTTYAWYARALVETGRATWPKITNTKESNYGSPERTNH